MTRILTNAIEANVPWAAPSEAAKEYWSEECQDVVRDTRRLFYEHLQRNTDESEARYKESRNRKIATIRRAKRKQFRDKIAEVSQSAVGI